MFRKICVLLSLVLLGVAFVACQAAPEATATPSAPRPGVTAAAATATRPPAAVTPSPAAEKPRRGGTFRAGFQADISDFDPHAPTTSMQYGMIAIYDTLMSLDLNLKLVPQLAESWQLSADGLSLTIKLRKGAKFHDGTDFNAKAAKFSLDRALTIQPRSSTYAEIEAISEVEAVDDSTIRLKLKTTSGVLLFGLAELGGMMVSPAAIEKFGKDYPRNPVGAGPYEFVEWVKNDHYTVKRFEGYWNKDNAGFFDQIVYRAIPDDTTRIAAFRAGQLDYIDVVPAKDVPSLEADPNLVFQETAGWGWYYFRMNNTKPPFDNKALRQAVAYAIDREAIIKSVFLGRGVPAKGPISPSSWAYKAGNVEGYSYNPDKAKQKLAEAGYPGGLKFKVVTGVGPEFQQLAQVVQAQLAKVGLETEIDLKDATTVVSLMTNGDFTAVAYRWGGFFDPHATLARPYHPKGLASSKFVNTPAADPLLDKAGVAMDVQERARLYQESEKITVENSPEVWISHMMENVAFRKNVRGIKVQPGRYYTSRFIPSAWFAQ